MPETFLIMLQAYIFHCFYSSFHTFTRKTSWKNDKQKCLKYSWILVVQTLTQVFSCDFCDIFKNTMLTEDLRVIASEPSYPPLFLVLLPALYKQYFLEKWLIKTLAVQLNEGLLELSETRNFIPNGNISKDVNWL